MNVCWDRFSYCNRYLTVKEPWFGSFSQVMHFVKNTPTKTLLSSHLLATPQQIFKAFHEHIRITSRFPSVCLHSYWKKRKSSQILPILWPCPVIIPIFRTTWYSSTLAICVSLIWTKVLLLSSCFTLIDGNYFPLIWKWDKCWRWISYCKVSFLTQI